MTIPSEPRRDSSTPPVVAVAGLDDADPELTALRHLVMHDPAEGVRAVRRAVRAHASGVRHVNLTILLAEAYQRHGQLAEAVRAGYDAAVAARPYDLRHHVIALGIGADLAICDRRPTAVQACTTFFQATTQQPQPDLLRVILAGALRAVAIYQHQSCREAHHQLQVLAARTPADNAAAATLDAGLAAMDAGCVPGCVPPPVGPLPPLPGAVLDPDVTAADVGVFARRVRLHPALHTPASSPPQTSNQRLEADHDQQANPDHGARSRTVRRALRKRTTCGPSGTLADHTAAC
jgi:hypothetical protein